MTRLAAMLRGSPYQGYAYAYPHKTAYRRFAEPIPLRSLWERENRQSLFLYFHLPFCEMRCGFCNLFTQSQPKQGLVGRYLDALEREVDQLECTLGDARFACFALGGGTPTFLSVAELTRVFDLARRLGVEFGRVPVAIETSPDTAEPEKLALLREWNVTRVSLGVQSFREDEVRQVARPQRTAAVERALDNLAAADFPSVNLDLIYGLPGQTEATWRESLDRALESRPTEIFLYPLYVRPLTGLGKSGRVWDDERLTLYRLGRDRLRDAGFEQVSMRFFRRPTAAESGPRYCCQEDGMVGVGCGARSYTQGVHYSREYAVGASGIRAILADYLEQTDEAFTAAAFGYRLDGDEQRRRYLLQSLLQTTGLDLAAYRGRFGTSALEDVPELAELDEHGFMTRMDGRLALTPAGMERSDAIGPWLYSSQVRERMDTCELR
jgi:oxygen-independent coproporphyrinogen III oxidase